MTKKKGKSLDIGSIFSAPERPKIKLDEKKVKAIETILKDDALKSMSSYELENILDAYKSGRKGK